MRSTHRRIGPPAHEDTGGFTLVELAVVIAIVALLLGALLAPLATQLQVRKSKETERVLRDVKETLIGFAIARGRLPCPDSDDDGIENLVVGPAPQDCAALEGSLPWRTLGISPTDSWGRIYRYRVTQEFAYPALTGEPYPASPQLDLADTGEIVVISRGDDPNTLPVESKAWLTKTGNAAAVVVSVGNNGAGGGRLDGPPLGLPTGGHEARECERRVSFRRGHRWNRDPTR